MNASFKKIAWTISDFSFGLIYISAALSLFFNLGEDINVALGNDDLLTTLFSISIIYVPLRIANWYSNLNQKEHLKKFIKENSLQFTVKEIITEMAKEEKEMNRNIEQILKTRKN